MLTDKEVYTYTEIQNHLRSLGACDEATRWGRGYVSIQEAWEACRRGDWLLWYATKIGVDQKLLVQAVCLCAREALQYVPAGEDGPLRAIETTEAWTRGEATIKEVEAAADAVIDAVADAASTTYAASSASCAAHAASVAYAAADAVINAVADAAYAASDDDIAVVAASRARSADLIRQVIPSI